MVLTVKKSPTSGLRVIFCFFVVISPYFILLLFLFLFFFAPCFFLFQAADGRRRGVRFLGRDLRGRSPPAGWLLGWLIGRLVVLLVGRLVNCLKGIRKKTIDIFFSIHRQGGEGVGGILKSR